MEGMDSKNTPQLHNRRGHGGVSSLALACMYKAVMQNENGGVVSFPDDLSPSEEKCMSGKPPHSVLVYGIRNLCLCHVAHHAYCMLKGMQSYAMSCVKLK